MRLNARLRREICRLLVAVSDGEATPEQHARLDALVRDNPQARNLVVDAITQMSDLEWEVRESQFVTESVSRIDAAAAPAGGAVPRASRRATPIQPLWPALRWLWRPTVGAFLLGVAATALLTARLGFRRVDDIQFVQQGPAPRGTDATAPVARLVSNTSNLFDAAAGHAIKAGEAIHAGRSVTLFEGVAEVQFDHSVSIRLKGPALLAIDDAGIAHLKYGRILVTNQGDRDFQFDVPVATTSIAPNSYVGFDGHGEDVFSYVFEGEARLTPTRWTEVQSVKAGQALRVRTGARSEMQVNWMVADSKSFDFDLLMASDQIRASDDYVAMVKQAAPVGYWRFENGGGFTTPNEMSDRHALRLQGDGVRIASRDGSGVAEFVVRDSAACLLSDDSFDDLASSDYSVEMWVKPSHFHWGTLAALVARAAEAEGAIERHAMLVELHGAIAPPEGRSKALRLLHRTPPSEEFSGTSCFSDISYRTQAWQHVAAVKQGAEMQLFLDGTLVATAQDSTQLPQGLQLVVGQLFSFGAVRPFVGHIDELAIYATALPVEEIVAHVQAMRTAPTSGGAESVVRAEEETP